MAKSGYTCTQTRQKGPCPRLVPSLSLWQMRQKEHVPSLSLCHPLVTLDKEVTKVTNFNDVYSNLMSLDLEVVFEKRFPEDGLESKMNNFQLVRVK